MQFNPPESLLKKILNRLERERLLLTFKKRLGLGVGSFLAAMILSLPAWPSIRTEFLQSGFHEYLSLLFSDFGTVAQDWQAYAFSLLESLPIIALVEILGIFLILLMALKFTLKYGKAFLKLSQQYK